MKSQRKPRWNPAIAPSEPTPFSFLISLSHLSLHLWLGASPPPLIENPLKYCWFFAFAGVIPEMGGRTHLCGCARGRGRWVSGCRRLLIGQWLSSAAARACAVAGGGLGLISSLSPFLSRCGFFFVFSFFWESCCGILHQVEPEKINFLIWYWWIFLLTCKFSF